MADRFAGVAAEPLAAHAGAPLAQRAGNLVRLTLNRPAEHNRLDPADVDALLALFEQLATGGGTRALVITGAGEKTFSSGYTLQAIVDELDARFERMLDALETLPFPTIAALNGSVYGGATDLALCCDFRIGSPGLKMFMPAAKFGLHYYPGGLRRYLTRLGLPAASKLMLTAMTIESDEMLRIGFLTDLVPRDALCTRVDAYLDNISRTAPGVVAQMKQHLHALARAGLESEAGRAAMASMADAYRESLASEELRARLARLLDEKRRPQ
ncbi:MAG: enoyl-CoA hydratase/isomerase family protein [Burkholderiales bacterium]|nr:enoyl-CoA hydratase/isomerase family protein [Burkholderiaceae bacterium]MCZ2415396.1 enoyl-CoA hydratase/isomerase family protein [Burkholderiales bacterium]